MNPKNALLLFQRVRFYCSQKQSEQRLSDSEKALYILLLNDIGFFSEEECEAMSASDFKGYLKELYQSRFQGLESKLYAKNTRAFEHFLNAYDSPRYAGHLPYHHRLSEKELHTLGAQLWETCFAGKPSFNEGLKQFATFDTQSYPDAIEQIGSEILARGYTRMYGLFYLSYGYCVHPHGFIQDFSYDDFFWFPPDLSWVLYAEGHGYLQAWGNHPVPPGIISW